MSFNIPYAMDLKDMKGWNYLQFTEAYPPAWGYGGPVRLMYDYASWASDAGFQTTVITGDAHHDHTRITSQSEMLSGIKVKRVRVFCRNLIKHGLYLISPSMLISGIRMTLRSKRRMVLHIGVFRGAVPIYATLIKIIFPKKVLLIHSAFGMLHYKRSNKRKFYDFLFTRALLRNIDIFLAQNDHEVQSYQDLLSVYGVKDTLRSISLFPLHVHTMGILELGAHQWGENRSKLRKRYGIPGDSFVAIFLGRLHPAKGIMRAMESFLCFSKMYDGKSLMLIVGRDDGFQGRITEYIENHNVCSKVRVINNVYKERFDYYSLSDIFIGFPTIHEETMLASVEALRCGTPVLVSREADIPFVEEGGAGFVIDYSVESALSRFQRIAEKPRVFRENALDVASKYFSEQWARKNYIALLREFLTINGSDRGDMG